MPEHDLENTLKVSNAVTAGNHTENLVTIGFIFKIAFFLKVC